MMHLVIFSVCLMMPFTAFASPTQSNDLPLLDLITQDYSRLNIDAATAAQSSANIHDVPQPSTTPSEPLLSSREDTKGKKRVSFSENAKRTREFNVYVDDEDDDNVELLHGIEGLSIDGNPTDSKRRRTAVPSVRGGSSFTSQVKQRLKMMADKTKASEKPESSKQARRKSATRRKAVKVVEDSENAVPTKPQSSQNHPLGSFSNGMDMLSPVDFEAFWLTQTDLLDPERKDYLRYMTRETTGLFSNDPKTLATLTAAMCYMTSIRKHEDSTIYFYQPSMRDLTALGEKMQWSFETLHRWFKVYFENYLGKRFILNHEYRLTRHSACIGSSLPLKGSHKALLANRNVEDIFNSR